MLGAGDFTKAAHQGIHAGVDLCHNTRKGKLKSRDVLKAGHQISNCACATEKVLNPEVSMPRKLRADMNKYKTFALLAYKEQQETH